MRADKEIRVTGMILKSDPVGEYDKRITILTGQRGKVSAFVRGVRKQNAAFSGMTEPFLYGEFTLISGRSAYTVIHINISEYFRELSGKFPAVYYGFYFLELSDYFAREANDEKNLLLLLYRSLRALTSEKFSPELVKCVFELKCLDINGFAPALDSCVSCKRPEAAAFSAQSFGVLCPDCALRAEDAVFIGAAALYAMRFIERTPIEKLYTFKLSDEALGELTAVCDSYMKVHTDRRFSSLDILKDIETSAV